MQLYWVALKSIWHKEIQRFMRIWVQTLVPPVITMTLYFIIFGNLIGSRIGEMHGFTYMQFIVPGLIMMAVITNAYANVASSFFSAKFQRNIEELLVAPVPTHVIIAGYVGGGVARGLCVGVLVTAVSLFFVPFQVHSWVFVALTLLLTAVLFSLAGLLNAFHHCGGFGGVYHRFLYIVLVFNSARTRSAQLIATYPAAFVAGFSLPF